MKLRVLVENNTLIDHYFRGEPGVSYYLEADGKKILFDTGYSDLFIENGREEADYIIEDSALAYKTPEGLVIITGCSHSGICNIIEQAKSIFKEDRIVDVIGGFHLQNPSKKQMRGTKSYFEKIKPAAVHASHCTDLKSKIELAEVVDLKEVGVGLELNY